MGRKFLTLLKEYIIEHKIFLLLFIILGIITYKFSTIDIKITSLFYNGSNFFLEKNAFGLIIYHGAYYLTVIVILVLLGMFLANIIKNVNPFGLNRKAIIFLMAVFILAPGIVVNLILKEHVGRPRPADVTVFGGEKIFQPPFVISNQCESNCSFVSGHASFAFTFMVIGFFFTGMKRKVVLSSAFLFGAIVGFVRIFQGRHFFTDVMFAFFFTWLVITLLYKFFYPNNELPDTISK